MTQTKQTTYLMSRTMRAKLYSTVLLFFVGFACVSKGNAQSLSWTAPAQDTLTRIGGAPDRQGLGVASANNLTMIAYTDRVTIDPQGDAFVYFGTSNGVGPFWNTTQVTVAGPQTVAARGNPALSVNPFVTSNIALAYVDAFGAANFVISNDGGNSWGSGVNSCGSGYSGSAGLTFFNNNFYFGVMNAANATLTLCRFDTTGVIQSVQNIPGITMGFGPALATFGPNLYVAVTAPSGNHQINLYASSDGVNFGYNGGASGDQSSTMCSMAVHNGLLYLGFRTNDGDHKFLYKASGDGVNWTGAFDPHYTMGGPPALVQVSIPGNPNTLLNVFAQNDSDHYIYSSYSPN